MPRLPANTTNANTTHPGLIKGYPMLAGQIQVQPEMAIFRRFIALNAENILYLQAELTFLENELRKQQLKDNSSNHEKKIKYAVNWYQLRNSHRNGDTKQLDLVQRIRETLWQYSRHRISSRFLHSKQHMDLSLLGPDATTWGSVSEPHSHSPDLASLCPRRKEDPFSNWVADNAITKLVRCGCACFMKSSRAHMRGIVGYEDVRVMQVTYWLTSVIASLLPIGSIVILYKVHSMAARLGIIAAFNVLVSLCLNAFTNAKRAEVFAITAALVNPFVTWEELT
ncbi:hypothetical protein BU23DRAFT_582048 [Bimuria novae-zelandiae CBS 107.79]|uniref:DUF6594 domain-containing protein n=1 Tax=Bimuria novae-zelandiae CBS 107.79 TaxID=1447943 RepID=A0A6A5V2M7_9PLEO|nr:hypothetical protein BU23DRAFT_582048 [Bimuria novae-zelandiae CBS 107.79]